jgi:predicted ATPase
MAKPALRISRIKMQNWMNFLELDVPLSTRAFLVGPNASGKSNFLDSVLFLHDLVASGGGLARAVESRGGMKGVRSLFARRQPEVSLAVEVTDSEGNGWRYALSFTQQDPKSNAPRVIQELVETIAVSGQNKVILKRPDTEDRKDPERTTQTAMEQVTANRDFRQLAEFFRSIQYLHAVPHLIREGLAAPDHRIGQDPYGRDLLKRISETNPRSRESRLKKIEIALEQITPQLRDLELCRDVQGRPHLQARFEHWRPQGAFQQETQFSDGTLRLIGLFWSLLDDGGPLLLEEPELSLHSQVVQQLAPLIHRLQQRGRPRERDGQRQILLSTHSVELLSDEGIAPEEIVLIMPGKEGSRAAVGHRVKEVRETMEAGLPAAAAVRRTVSSSPRQLSLQFDGRS